VFRRPVLNVRANYCLCESDSTEQSQSLFEALNKYLLKSSAVCDKTVTVLAVSNMSQTVLHMLFHSVRGK